MLMDALTKVMEYAVHIVVEYTHMRVLLMRLILIKGMSGGSNFDLLDSGWSGA